MKKIFTAADAYLAECDWRDITLLKFCLLSLGLLAGLAVPKKHKATFAFSALTVFICTYVPIMAKFWPFVSREFDRDE